MKSIKCIICLNVLMAIALTVQAQAPQFINYQAIARNVDGSIITTPVNVRFTVHNGGTGGSVEYQETYSSITPNTYGLLTLHVGGGVPVTGSLNTISWGSSSKYLQVEIDNGSGWVDMGAQQLVSVPYALYAANAGSSTTYTSGTGINISGTAINAQNNTALWNANELQGVSINSTLPTTGQVLAYNGINWLPETITSGSGGTVTSINTSAPLTGGPITTTGTIGLATTGSAGTYGSSSLIPVITTDPYGRVSGITTAAVTTPSVTMNGDVTGLSSASTVAKIQGNAISATIPTIGQVLQWSGSAWTPAMSGGSNWALSGNSGTTAGTNYIGTIDAQSLLFKVQGINAGFIDCNSSTANIMFGTSAGNIFTSTGTYNCGFGYWALESNTTGSTNSAFGYNSLGLNYTGSQNTSMGYAALLHSNANGNTALGYQSLYNNSSGYENTGIGYTALYTATTGYENTGLGAGADVTDGSFYNSVAIGFYASVNASNKVRIGNSSVTSVEGAAMYTVSDRRFKTNISENVKGLDFINKLRPVTYNFEAKKFDAFLMKNKPDSIRNKVLNNLDYTDAENIIHSGFIAQEVEQSAKESGYNFSGLHIPANANDNYSIAYSEFTIPLVKAVQELSIQNENQQKQIEIQDQKMELLKKQINELEEQIKKMEKQR